MLAALAVFVLFVFGVEIHYMGLENVPFLTKVLLFVLLNLNLVALCTLVFFVGKSLFKVYMERKNRVLGYRFKTKFMVVLVVLTLIPSVFLFIVSSGVVTNYLDRWFDPQVRQPLELSIEIAKSAYEGQRQQTLAAARAVASGERVSSDYRISRLDVLPENASETLRQGFEGREDVEVISSDGADLVRAVIPLGRGVLIVEKTVDSSLSRSAEVIRESYQNYLTLESWKLPIKANYLLILGFFTLLIVFSALWVALKIARGITDPIQALANATEEVARGNLDAAVSFERDDEIGLLVKSFNKMVRDLKENKETLQKAYQDSEEERLVTENIVQNINSGVIYLDAEGTVQAVNRAASRILGIAEADVVKHHYSVLLTKLQSDELRNMVTSIRLRDFRPLEREVVVNAGEQRIFLRIFITTLGIDGSVLGTIVVFDDLTEIAKAQKALAWQEVARRMAHEIKNPLTPIKLSTEHMIKKWQSEDPDFGKVFERSTKTIVREVDSLKRLVDEFSRYGKLPEIRKAPVRIAAILDGVLNLYRDYREVDFGVSVDDTEAAVELDAEQFKRVLINIVDNAIQAMQSRGRIDIMVHHDRTMGSVVVEITDNGPGIRDEDKEKLFLPYFSTRKDGTGLGLAIAHRVIQEHGGRIRVRDNKPRGTVFTIELPI